MQLTPEIAVLSAVLLPLIGAVLSPLLHRLFRSYGGWLLALIPAWGFVAMLSLAGQVARDGQLTVAWDWAPSWNLRLSFLIDGLSLTFALAIAGIGAFVVLYSASYLKGHPHQGRFMAFLLGFMAAMQGLVLADNLVALYLFWELTSVTSFLLIGFEHGRQAARRAATQALVVTGMGGLALLAAGVGIAMISGSWDLSAAGGLQANPAYP
ncbi:MAG: proton-conducting transporter membrane subunit, partial [Devosia sp.]|nr:proton-conducting transporter membrane subunit [Devosia sp.]